MEVVCLDTNILIAHKRAKKQDKSKTRFYELACKGFNFAITSVTAFELLRGDDREEDAFWLDFFKRIKKYDFDLEAAHIAGNIYRKLKEDGRMIGVQDILIASIALKNELKLATDNIKHFGQIDGLNLV